ncbi:MAG: hypothetical protein ACD_63C00081G0007 [uncultured bacterium]|nr:MAG: hypothetical protein ACD_63C00081G0007 [uncultured bacterium]
MDKGLQQSIRKIIKKIFSFLSEDPKISFEKSDDPKDNILSLNLEVKDPGILIGYDGMNLIALQHITRIIFKRSMNEDDGVHLLVDINDYKKERTARLKEIARGAAKQVVANNRLVVLSPMNSFERRLVHLELAENEEVTTESFGEGEDRRIVVRPQR